MFPAIAPVGVFQGAQRLTDGRVLYLNGAPGFAAQVFSPDSGSFAASSAMFVNRSGGFGIATLTDGRIMLNGGFVPSTQAAELYDAATDSVAFAGSQDSPDVWGQVLVRLASGGVMALGGFGTDVGGALNYYYASVHMFDPATGRFGQAGGLLTGRQTPAAVLLNDGRVLVVGGCRGLPCEAEIYSP